MLTGNYLNGTGPKGGAYGFKLEFLTKLADTKTADNKSTLLHYLVASIERKVTCNPRSKTYS